MSIKNYIDDNFEHGIESLSKFIELDNLSLDYDKEYLTNGKNEKAINHVIEYSKSLNIQGLSHELYTEEGRAPCILFEIQPFNSSSESSIMLYGHIDKQPHLSGWHDWTGPTTPVIRDGRLFGRGGADDGYSYITTLLSVKAVQETGGKHPRIVLFMETEEESGSPNLPYWLKHLKDKIGNISALYCMDSLIGDYERLWITYGLKGVCNIVVKVQTHTNGMHSGNYSGRLPDPMFVHRYFMDQFCDVHGTWRLNTESTNPPLNANTLDKIKKNAELSNNKHMDLPLLEGVQPLGTDPVDTFTRNVWYPTMTITGHEGFGDKHAGNVIHSSLTLKYSFRLPPNVDSSKAIVDILGVFNGPNPCSAQVVIEDAYHHASGFCLNEFSKEMEQKFENCSQKYWGKELGYVFCGGSIPFLNMIATQYPDCYVIPMGVLGPHSNEHGPNESIDIEYWRKLTYTIADMISE